MTTCIPGKLPSQSEICYTVTTLWTVGFSQRGKDVFELHIHKGLKLQIRRTRQPCVATGDGPAGRPQFPSLQEPV